MKKLSVLILCAFSLNAFAQTVKLDAGRKITAVSSSTVDMDMGMAGQMKIDGVTTSQINIKSKDGNRYTGETVITKMKMNMDAMGQTNSFDSDKKEDMESESGKEIGKALNKPAAIFISETDGTVTEANPEKKEEESGNPMAALMGEQGPATVAQTAFLVIPSDKKTGDKWTVSTKEGEMSVVKNYEIQSAKDGLLTVKINAVKKGTISQEAQGAQIDVTLNTTTESIITADAKTGLVKTNVTKGSGEGSMDVMGQSMPLSMKMSSTSTFE